MPKVFATHHNNILTHFYNSGKERVINNLMHVWAIHNEGFCFSANIFVKIVPILNDYEVMGLVHRLNSQDYIVTDDDGEIVASGTRFLEVLDIMPHTLYNFGINIQLLAPKMMNMYRDYFTNFGMEEEDPNKIKTDAQQNAEDKKQAGATTSGGVGGNSNLDLFDNVKNGV